MCLWQREKRLEPVERTRTGAATPSDADRLIEKIAISTSPRSRMAHVPSINAVVVRGRTFNRAVLHRLEDEVSRRRMSRPTTGRGSRHGETGARPEFPLPRLSAMDMHFSEGFLWLTMYFFIPTLTTRKPHAAHESHLRTRCPDDAAHRRLRTRGVE